MSIHPIQNDAGVLNLTRAGTKSQIPDNVAEKAAKKDATGDFVAFAASGHGSAEFTRIDAGKEGMFEVARTIRAADQAMSAIGGHLEEMKVALAGIVKNFPPFPPGSDERVRLLKSYTALRKQIDALTFPPPTSNGTDAAKLIGSPAVVPGAGGMSVVSGDGRTVVIASREAHSGPNGLDVPQLQETPDADATDAQIYHAINRLDAAVKTLGEKRAGLAADMGNLLA